MKKLLLSLLLLFIPSSLLAEVHINMQDRVHNQPPGYCFWSCLESLCRHHKQKAGYGLLESRKLDNDVVVPCPGGFRIIPKNVGYMPAVDEKLSTLVLDYTYELEGYKDIEFLKKAIKDNLGAIVGISKDAGICREYHAVIIIDINDTKVKYIDPNNPTVDQTNTREWFDKYWTGLIFVINPK